MQSTVFQAHIVYDGTESAVYLGPKIWEIRPSKIKKHEPFCQF